MREKFSNTEFSSDFYVNDALNFCLKTPLKINLNKAPQMSCAASLQDGNAMVSCLTH